MSKRNVPLVAGTISSPIKKKLPDDKAMCHKQVVTRRRFPFLIPLGMVTVIHTNEFWVVKCGPFQLSGHGGDIEWILKEFLDYVQKEMGNLADNIRDVNFTE